MEHIFCDFQQTDAELQNGYEFIINKKAASVYKRISRAYNFGLNPTLPVADDEVIMKFLRILIAHEFNYPEEDSHQMLILNNDGLSVKVIYEELVTEILEKKELYKKVVELLQKSGYLDSYGKRISHARGDVRRILLGIIWFLIKNKCFTHNYCPCRGRPKRLTTRIIIKRIAAVWDIHNSFSVKDNPETLIAYAKSHIYGLSEIENC